MDIKDPLIEAAVATLSEAPNVGYGGQQRVDLLMQLWSRGDEEQCIKLAYEWVKTGVLSRQEFHTFIHNLVA